jgi:hypothetical protein
MEQARDTALIARLGSYRDTDLASRGWNFPGSEVNLSYNSKFNWIIWIAKTEMVWNEETEI